MTKEGWEKEKKLMEEKLFEGEEIQLEHLRENIDRQDKRIGALEHLTIETTKISTILEMQQKMSENQDNTLVKINDNLTNLNHKTEMMGQRVDSLEDRVEKHNKDSTVNILELAKKVGWTIVTLAIGALFTWIVSS